ncbi:hypothetical protein [Thalassolituus hydrocarboniclasticus]|uniref:Outer membrane beta-barrel porin/alpha-amylase n=1 Tax=Thalassolituus hydrocarboniclasticus TaxID=2742796 RepID=A0ABY6ACE7_9GAMM|nr:hypothetical protein [Thalassolituus hydrocarboniclasticus]UXD88714.1 hypothetical protein HUF19_15300 [Thalassolituus hydrocarboniclasticus]
MKNQQNYAASVLRNGVAVAVLSVGIMYTSPALAAGKIAYSHVKTAAADQGNEIDKNDLVVEYSRAIYVSDDKHSSMSLGIAVQDTNLYFDEAQLPDMDLVKIKLPLSGSQVLDSGSIVSWTLTPGLHGEADDLSEAESRLEGQAFYIKPSGNLRWVLGGGFGDQFGETKLFPVLGAIWTASAQTEVTLMFPSLKYKYTTEQKKAYSLSLVPVGSQWTWKAGDLGGNTEAGNVSVSGLKLSAGLDWPLANKQVISAELGRITEREFKITRQSDPSFNGTVELEDAWFAQLGWAF